MALILPKAFWPATIVAGVNDKLDVKRISDSVLFAATIAAGTYYSPGALARAVQRALNTCGWANRWGVEAIGSNMAGFNDGFETDTVGWLAANGSAGLEPFTFWNRVIAWTNNQAARGFAWLRTAWAVNNTTTKGLTTSQNQLLGDGTYAGIGWRLNEWFRIRFKVRAFDTNAGKIMNVFFSVAPSTLTALQNPASVLGQWTQYEFRTQWTANLPSEPGDLYITIGQTGTSGTLEFDDIEVVSENTQTGHFAIGGNAAFSLLFATGVNAATSARDILGFGLADFGSATSIVAPNQHRNGWYAEDPVADDTGDLPAYERAQSRALGGQTYGLDFGTRYERRISLSHLRSYKTWKADEGASHLNEGIEHLFDDGWQRLRWWPDGTVEGTYEDLVLDADAAKKPPRKRLSPGNALYSHDLSFLKFVP